jgi:hypothetical protein
MLYQIGDIVKIVEYETETPEGDNRWDEDAEMIDEYAGAEMTIEMVDEACGWYIMKEDDGRWAWYPEMIEALVSGANTAPSERAPDYMSDYINQLRVGDTVKIVDGIPSVIPKYSATWASDMEEFLGKTMTIISVDDGRHKHPYFRMKEDRGRWAWSDDMFTPYIPESDLDPMAEEELFRFVLREVS